MRIILILISFFILSFKPVKKYERDYQREFCKQGIMEYKLDDNTRVDCLTDEYAIEIDFARKSYECIGQALYYGIKTNKKPACALIVKKDEYRFLRRLETVSNEYNIKVFIINK